MITGFLFSLLFLSCSGYVVNYEGDWPNLKVTLDHEAKPYSAVLGFHDHRSFVFGTECKSQKYCTYEEHSHVYNYNLDRPVVAENQIYRPAIRKGVFVGDVYQANFNK